VENGRLLRCGPAGTSEFEPLTLKKNTIALWLSFRLVQFASRRICFEVRQASKKRRRLNEKTSSGTQVVADIGKILESKAGADCKIRTSCGQVFELHRCILAGKTMELILDFNDGGC
jgi:hypothetical protein